MSSVVDHYTQHLGPVYTWMAGGFDSALQRGAAEIDALNLARPAGATAVDLGAGFGMHAIPLARLGYKVVAIDSCAALLDDLRSHSGDLPIEAIDGDMLAFGRYVNARPQLILCMGDTLTHLPDRAAVSRLIADVAAALVPGGHFVVSFRDYSRELEGDKRFIPVRSDAHRIFTCFLEYSAAQVTVHDLLHERDAGEQWKLQVSSYTKLRLPPEWVSSEFELAGFAVRREAGLSGMVRLVGQYL
ncbi:MAG: class I SAM-dependent methyltransferase [Pseudomonadota bacterium]